LDPTLEEKRTWNLEGKGAMLFGEPLVITRASLKDHWSKTPDGKASGTLSRSRVSVTGESFNTSVVEEKWTLLEKLYGRF